MALVGGWACKVAEIAPKLRCSKCSSQEVNVYEVAKVRPHPPTHLNGLKPRPAFAVDRDDAPPIGWNKL